ncbi:dnaJ homolog subfamily C member 25 homolog [Biomphalaria glabrata]|uniref:DnaJ homolog subfamily C member 25 homolog n=1 Tax=Biomphalaria glabrata TaxID=6526 RepID=A0A9W3BJB3_BIOGL|nr:dnaJ homolog subfamily C member 25 homolog [Biomphalaria glabrata]KAI8760163.1 putative dnaJ-like protein subfamily C member 25 [Biomphalaria glabrata]KAI8783954.1 dnaJ subfamily C member 25 [Biomphalaria glabrata]
MISTVQKHLICLFIWASLMFSAHAFIEGLYCGTENCYEVLNVARDATKGEITKAYRKLAKKWHPDMHRKQDDKDSASEMFLKIANAYEILRDEEQRNDYDYMLDNPDEYYSIYYRYYKRRVTPKVDVRLVIAVSITVISIVQYFSHWNNYTTAINYLCKDQKYRIRAMDIARSEGLLNNKKKNKTKTKEELKEEEEATVRKIIEEKMDIRGGYQKPKVTDVLWIQLVLLPYHIAMYIVWWVRWVWKFNVQHEEYGKEEQLYLIRKNLGISQSQFDMIEEHEIDDYLHKKLWIKDLFKDWKAKKEEETKSKLAESARYKMYRRYVKKGGAGQMSFGPE